MKIKLFENENIGDIYKLFKECFGDDKETVDLFLNSLFKKENTVIAVQNNEIIAQLFIIEAPIIIEGKHYKAAYLYALGTLKQHRKKGVMGEMMAFAEDLLKERSYDYMFLCPASEELFNYYEKFGFEKSFKSEKINLTKAQILHFRDSEITESVDFNKEIFYKFRNEALNNLTFVKWGEDALNLQSLYTQGECACENEIQFFCEHRESDDLIFNLSTTNYKLSRFCGSLINFLRSGRAEIHLPIENSLDLPKEEYYEGMIKPLKEDLPTPQNIFMGINLG